jgi:signal transduction histidine kinase
MSPGWLRDLPIRRKLVAVIVLTSGVALIVASAALLLLDALRYQDDLLEDLETLAAVVGDNSAAALMFDDVGAARENVAAVAVKSTIEVTALYGRTGAVFAEYRRAPNSPRPPEKPGFMYRDRAFGPIEVLRDVVFRGEPVGTIYVRGTLNELYDHLLTRALTVGLILLAAWLLTLLLSSWLQHLIADPLLQLAGTARRVSSNQDYSLRATPHGRDEIGLLVLAFNDMLSQIQRRDQELIAAKEFLEERVTERTAQLQQELDTRQRAERALEERNSELEQTNRELDDFAYIASHDLKEPLRGIHNYARFLIEDYGDRFGEDARHKLDTLARLSRRMETLIDSLLHYSRLGRTDPAAETVAVQELVQDVLDRLSINLQEQKVEVRIPRQLPVIRSDRVRMGEVFFNLVTNAMKYNDKPERWIEIGTADAAGADGGGRPDEWVFYVRDNGIGIPERHLASVFRIFKRLHARDQFGGGTGAGLTIVRKIIERQQGRIWIESQSGEGTTVFFTVPKEA